MDNLGLQIPLTELTLNETLLVTGDTPNNTPTAPMMAVPEMSQTTELFEETDRMSDEPLKYIEEPTNHPTPEFDRIMGEQAHTNELQEGTQIWATQMGTTNIHVDLTDLWGPCEVNIHQAAGENPLTGGG